VKSIPSIRRNTLATHCVPTRFIYISWWHPGSIFPYQNLAISSVPPLRAATTQSSDDTHRRPHDTRIADLTTAHHNFIPIKHRSYPNTVYYYLDSTNYRLTKTKTDKLTQRLAKFSYMHAYHSFQSELCFGCLERKSGIVQSLSSASSQFRIADP